jgi:hypothetical protein
MPSKNEDARRRRRADPISRRKELDRDNAARRTDRYRKKHAAYERCRREDNIISFRAYQRDYYARKLKSNRVLLTPEQRRANARAACRAHWEKNRQQYRTRTLNYVARKKNAKGAQNLNHLFLLLSEHH